MCAVATPDAEPVVSVRHTQAGYWESRDGTA